MTSKYVPPAAKQFLLVGSALYWRENNYAFFLFLSQHLMSCLYMYCVLIEFKQNIEDGDDLKR